MWAMLCGKTTGGKTGPDATNVTAVNVSHVAQYIYQAEIQFHMSITVKWPCSLKCSSSDAARLM